MNSSVYMHGGVFGGHDSPLEPYHVLHYFLYNIYYNIQYTLHYI